MPTGTMRRMFVESSSSSSSGREAAEPAAAVLCAPRPRRVQVRPCSADLILGPPPFLLNSTKKQKERNSKPQEEQAGGKMDAGWALFGGSPPARADNPLVHDPNFLLNQRPHGAVPGGSDLAIFYHYSRNYSHLPTYSSSSNSHSSSFAPSYAPAVRIQGFDVSACRSSHSSGGGRVLSARA